ncbi:DNA/RNA non-specific endonuclease [Aquimarina sp. BL5]|uniref:DNA/RNA non-specific endonuclease n=1 Tax=Aquimarina sp. BL5 TaxID=1714860 RepID=UPI000E49E6DC|nr:DNA/RNA non-specific endonuclease [Aquimarina sp. BL5]AXT49610.1 DNA/RNA non-specific endonuclease [Aquimarina sp. BL5]RKN05441.1 DNA/RNA non-specific endonuclease [Aquimarina sp. BL5]
MKLFRTNSIAFYFLFSFFLTACSVEEDFVDQASETIPLEITGELKVLTNYYDNEGPHDHFFNQKRIDGFTETYESGSKGSYAGGTVTLTDSGDWYLSDALIGSLSNDRKYGSKSVRIRNTGYAIMSFSMDNGAETVRIRHAKYGNNGNSTWRLIASYDNGVSWYYVGSEITTSSTTLNTVSFNVNETGNVRYGIQKTSGGSNRINIDNVEITIPSSGGGVAGKDSNITFGNPSDAGSNSDNYYLSKPDFILSYNNAKGTANWVSWHLSSAWTGNTPRCNCFKRDTSLPSSFFRATSSDYTNSGFDRGHLCPSADRNGSEDSNENTYYMTNIAPQAPDNNQRSWANFENYLRSLTLEGNEVHIITGVVGSGGTGRNGFASTIDGGNITVPDSFWKVALILPNGTNDINRVTTSTRVIAINVPNDQGISTDWTQFRTSVDSIESLTGYDLLENITNSIESVLESVIDNGPFN